MMVFPVTFSTYCNNVFELSCLVVYHPFYVKCGGSSDGEILNAVIVKIGWAYCL